MTEIGIFEKKGVLIVAELSANHNQDINIAVETIKAAKKAGADAVKLQTYTPDTLTIDCDSEYFQIHQGTLWDGVTLYELYKKAYTPWAWHSKLFQTAKEEGILCFSTPFDSTAVDFLEQFEPPAYKIASFELNDLPLIEYAASKKRPMIMSTGLANISEIKEALEICQKVGNDQICLLKCTSSYPAEPEDANLLTIPDMRKQFKVEVGLSDHTIGDSVAMAAVALGSKVVEKHFILDRKLGGPDAEFSMEPKEFKEMVKKIHIVRKSIGRVTYDLPGQALKNRKFRRSLFVVEDLTKGELFTQKNLKSIRPGDGVSPKYISQILGKKATCHIQKGTPFDWILVE